MFHDNIVCLLIVILHPHVNCFIFFSAGTPYAGGSFRVKLVLTKNFPTEPPKGFFLTRIFHPNVASNGEICVNTLKRDWKADYGIKHILLVSILTYFQRLLVSNILNAMHFINVYFA